MNECAQIMQIVDNVQQKVLKESTTCMCPNCHKKAIKSHVLQKKGILAPISPNRHLYEFKPTSAFSMPILQFKKVGINEAFTYYGFCNQHDTSIFKPIETDNVDWCKEQSQYLIGYRIACRELDIKQRMLKIIETTFAKLGINHNSPDVIARKQGLKDGIKDLHHYKSVFEQGIFHNDYSGYHFHTIESPYYLEACVASMVVPSYSVIPNEDTCKAELPENNFLAIFPYKEKTIVIVGLTTHTNNIWAKMLIDQITHCPNIKEFSKIVNDVMLLRTDYNCMSESLYNTIPQNEMDRFLEEWQKYGDNHSVYIRSDINIFHTYAEKTSSLQN